MVNAFISILPGVSQFFAGYAKLDNLSALMVQSLFRLFSTSIIDMAAVILCRKDLTTYTYMCL